jgi:tetratricopeptide (TPR) repeat protein
MGGSGPRHPGFRGRIEALLGLGLTGRLAKADRLISQAEKRAGSHPRAAISSYTKVVELLSPIAGMEREKAPRLGSALIGRGQLQEQVGDERGALDSYLRARRARIPLPPSALAFLARSFARQGDVQWEATTVYLDLVRALAGRQPPPGAQEVLAFLERRCVADPKRPQSAAAALSLCKQVMAADPSLGWPHYHAGVAHSLRGEYQEALPCLQQARELKCERPEALFYVHFAQGMVNVQAGQIEEAAPALRSAAEASPGRPEAHFALGKLLLQRVHGAHADDPQRSQLLSEAVARLTDAARLKPDDAESACWLGEAHFAAGDAAQAATAFRRAAALDAHRADYHSRLALSLRAIGAADEALVAAQAALALDPSSLPSHRLLAELSLEVGDFEEAAREFQVVLDADADDVEARVSLGAALRSLRRYAEAVAVLSPVEDQSGPAAFHLARCYAQLEDYGRAIPLLERLTGQRPDEWELWHCLGLGYANAERFAEAVEAFTKALAAGASGPKVALQRGHAYCKLGRLEEAASDYQAVLSSSPDDVEAMFAAACVSLARSDEEEALKLLTRLTELDGRHVSARLLSGSLWEGKGDLETAAEQYARAAELAPADPRVHRRLGVLRCRQADYESALRSFEQSALLGDESDELLYYLGLAAAHSGYLNVAIARWTKLAERHPDDGGLRWGIAKLHYLLGNEHARAGHEEEARREWDICLDSCHDDTLTEEIASLHLRSALVELASNHRCQVGQARLHLERALSLRPDSAVARYYLSICRLVAGEWDGYIAEAGQLLAELDPKLRAQAKYHLGVAWLAKDDPARAQPLLAEAAAEAGQQGLALDTGLALAMAQAKAGEWAEAVSTLQGGLQPAGSPAEGSGA